MANLLQKLIFRSGILCSITNADIGSLKSLHTLFDKYLAHMPVEFEQNRMVRTMQNFVLFDRKWLTIFDKVLTPFWKMFLWLKQLFDAKILIQSCDEYTKTIIFQCSKNYGTPTCVTRLKSCTKHAWQTRSVSTKTYRSLKTVDWTKLIRGCHFLWKGAPQYSGDHNFFWYEKGDYKIHDSDIGVTN